MTLHLWLLFIIWYKTLSRNYFNCSWHIIYHIPNGLRSVFGFWHIFFAVFVNSMRQNCVRMIFCIFVEMKITSRSFQTTFDPNEWMNVTIYWKWILSKPQSNWNANYSNNIIDHPARIAIVSSLLFFLFFVWRSFECPSKWVEEKVRE